VATERGQVFLLENTPPDFIRKERSAAMCHFIEPEFLLANLLMLSPAPVSMSRLNCMRRLIRNSVDEPIYIDISNNSMCAAVELRPEMFRWKDGAIVRAEDAQSYFSKEFVEEHFNSELNDSIREKTLCVFD
jgi:hypothetical protein